MTAIPSHLDDGHTECVRGYFVRILHSEDKARAYDHYKDGTLEDWLFCEPRVFGINDVWHLDDETKWVLFQVAMSGKNCDLWLKSEVKWALENHELSQRSCDNCRKYWYNHTAGTVVDRGDGQPLLRNSACPPSCETDAGCEKGHWKDPKVMSPRSKKIRDHFLEWRTVGCPVPHCKVMRTNWTILEELYKKASL